MPDEVHPADFPLYPQEEPTWFPSPKAQMFMWKIAEKQKTTSGSILQPLQKEDKQNSSAMSSASSVVKNLKVMKNYLTTKKKNSTKKMLK